MGRAEFWYPRCCGNRADEGRSDVFGNLDYLEVMNHTRVVDSLKNEPYTSEDDKALEDLGI